MANIGQTLFRFTGALMLAAGAIAIDHPRVADGPVARRMVADAAVVIATRDIPEGTSIVRGAVALLKWPAHAMPRGAYTSVESVVGTVAKSTISRGEPLVTGRLIGVSLQRDADGQLINSHVATIEVSPQEAENLAIAASQGMLSLALRGLGDPGPINGAVAVPAVEYFPQRATLVPRRRDR